MVKETQPPETTATSEADFDKWLAGEDGISKTWSGMESTAADSGPAAEVDAAILAKAKRAVNSGPQSQESNAVEQLRRGRRWSIPLAVAAVVVLSITVVTDLGTPLRESNLDYPLPAQPDSVQAPPPQLQKNELAELAAAPATTRIEASKEPAEHRLARDTADIDAEIDRSKVTRQRLQARVESERFAMMDEAEAKRSDGRATLKPAPAPAENTSAEESIETMRALLKAEKWQPAADQWRDFKRQYPDHSLDSEFRQKMEALAKNWPASSQE